MNQYTLEETAVINASAETIYQILIDYVDPNAHKAITPPRFFTKIEVVSGGVGDGTIVDVYTKAVGQVTKFTMMVIEAKKNRHVIEKDSDGKTVSEFFLEPLKDGVRTNVTIKTTGTLGKGIQAWIESKLAPKILRPVYKEELANLERVATAHEKTAAHKIA